MIKISLLIPIYNGEKYLSRLFDSLLAQDIPYDEYEIICVDDCSKDASVEIVKDYQARYPNFRLIQNDENRRVATNVNTLIDSAKGRYFMLYGQDDYIEPNCLARLHERLEKEHLDVLLFNYRRVYETEETQQECKIFTSSSKMRGIDWIKEQFKGKDYCQYILGYEWRAVYRTEYWRDNNIRCVDGMNYEDTIIMLKAIVYSDAVASIDDILYNYRINNSSITYQENFVKRGDLIFEFAFIVGQEVEDFYNEFKTIDTFLSVKLYNHLLNRYNNFTFDLIRTPNEHKRTFYKILRENKAFVESKRKYLNCRSRLLINDVLGYPLSSMCFIGYRLLKLLKH